jgi:hypothetical protein
MVVAVSTERYRAICDPLKHRQAYYKYIIVVLLLSIGVRVPRFFEFQLVRLENETIDYDTTNLSEDPMYVQFNAYWNELLVTGLLPLISLIIMNFRIYLKIRASSNFAQSFEKSETKGSSKTFKLKFDSERSSNVTESRVLVNSILNRNSGPTMSITSPNKNGSVDIEMAGID